MLRMANVIFHSSDLVCFTTLWPMLDMANLTLGKSLAHKSYASYVIVGPTQVISHLTAQGVARLSVG